MMVCSKRQLCLQLVVHGHLFSVRYIICLTSTHLRLGLPSILLPLGFLAEIFIHFLLPFACYIPVYLIILDLALPSVLLPLGFLAEIFYTFLVSLCVLHSHLFYHS